jgi:hypothetical protein
MKNLLETSPTNINNNNYYNNTNNTNYDNNLTTNNYNNSRGSDDQHGIVDTSSLTSSSLELASPREKEPLDSSSKEKANVNPPAWKVSKWDLFLNGKTRGGLDSLKLKVWFVNKSSGKNFTYMALLNTPWSSGRMKYNVADDVWNDSAHWKTVRAHYNSIKHLYDDVRSSKLAQTYKGSPTPVAVFVYKDAGIYFVDMVLDGTVYSYTLYDEVSDKAALGNIVATVKTGGSQKPMLTLEEGGFL